MSFLRTTRRHCPYPGNFIFHDHRLEGPALGWLLFRKPSSGVDEAAILAFAPLQRFNAADMVSQWRRKKEPRSVRETREGMPGGNGDGDDA